METKSTRVATALPDQCVTCRYRRGKDHTAVCAHRKHQLQQCVVEKGLQVLKRVPGPCAIVNMENNCPYVRQRLWVRIMRMFGADPA